MAGKGRQSWEKRQREKAKRDKQEAKRAEREERRNASAEDVEASEGPSEAELYARFAKLSEAHAAGNVVIDGKALVSGELTVKVDAVALQRHHRLIRAEQCCRLQRR